MATLSLGLLPALPWTASFSQCAELDATLLRRALDRLQAAGCPPKVTLSLENAIFRVRARAETWALSVGLLLLLTALGAAAIYRAQMPIMTLLDATLAYSGPVRELSVPSSSGSGWYGFDPDYHPRRVRQLHSAWIGILSAVYGLQWLQILLHRNAMARSIRRLNWALGLHGVVPVNVLPPPMLSLPAVACAILFLYCGIWWGVPMLLAAQSQRQYIRWIRPAIYRQVGDRLRLWNPPSVMAATGRCVRERCQATLPPAARFCPRCGAAKGQPLGAVG